MRFIQKLIQKNRSGLDIYKTEKLTKVCIFVHTFIRCCSCQSLLKMCLAMTGNTSHCLQAVGLPVYIYVRRNLVDIKSSLNNKFTHAFGQHSIANKTRDTTYENLQGAGCYLGLGGLGLGGSGGGLYVPPTSHCWRAARSVTSSHIMYLPCCSLTCKTVVVCVTTIKGFYLGSHIAHVLYHNIFSLKQF